MKSQFRGFLNLGLIAVFTLSLIAGGQAEEKPFALKTALKIDKLIVDELAKSGAAPAPLVNDDTFLRRASLDLTGTIPTPNEVTDFVLNPDPDKRSKLIDRLLETEDYADIWASYWREVIFSRATEVRSRVMQDVFESWMKDQLAQNFGWDKITTSLVTATGSTDKDGQTALIFAHTGEPEEVAAEAARIFLGIQIQCANCHNHPYEKWTREDFHQFAAFFPRVQVRRQPDDMRSFTVQSLEGQAEKAKARLDPDKLFARLDSNRDGKVTKQEASKAQAFSKRFDMILAVGDTNKDGALSKDEFDKAPRPDANQPGRGSLEHHMPDLNNPTAEGKLMQPVFFVNHAKMHAGADDLDRRQTVAKFITARSNSAFAKAFVNRIWAEMIGEGFTDTVDDMGPGHDPKCPEVLEALADDFAASGYDVKWLYRTIANTQVYQRQLKSADTTGDFAAASPTRLRSDQIFNSLEAVLGRNLVPASRTPGKGAAQRLANQGGRKGFSQLFGFDPSTPQADIIGTIPQALFMMNQNVLNNAEKAAGRTRLGMLLEENKDDRDALSELYLLVLTREPSPTEMDVNLEYIKSVGTRREAFEDIFWSLLNSSEFITKR